MVKRKSLSKALIKYKPPKTMVKYKPRKKSGSKKITYISNKPGPVNTHKQEDLQTLKNALELGKNFKGAYENLKETKKISKKLETQIKKQNGKTYISKKTGARLLPYFEKASEGVGKALTSVGVPEDLASKVVLGGKLVSSVISDAIDRPYKENGKVYVPTGPGSGVRNYRKPGVLF